jgi:haloacetate dehalogenase
VLPKWYDPVGVWKDWASDVHGEELDSGHMLAEEAPEATYLALRKFLA